MKNIEQQAAEVLLDRGVAWEVPAPGICRIIGKRKVKISIKALKLGTLLEVSRRYAALNLKTEDLERDPWKLINENLIPVCRITAVCVLNSRLKIKLFTGALAHFIRWRFTGNMLLEVMIFVANFSGLASFTSTIGLIRDLRITAPKDPSPVDQGS